MRLASKEVYERSEVLQLCGSNQESSVAILDWADKNNDIAERCNVAAASLELVYSLLFRLNNQYVLPLMVIGVSVLMLQGHVTEMVWGVLLALHLVRNKRQWTREFCRDVSEALKSSDNSREAAVRVVCYDNCAYAQKTAFQHADRCVPRAPRCAVCLHARADPACQAALRRDGVFLQTINWMTPCLCLLASSAVP